MTFALPGVEEREADSDGVCEQLSHLLQAMGYVAGLSKLTVCNAFPPSLPSSHPPSFSTVNLPPDLFLSRSLSFCFFLGPMTVSTPSSLTLSALCYLSQLFTFICLPPSAPTSSFPVWKFPRVSGRAGRWLAVDFGWVCGCSHVHLYGSGF